MEKIWYDTIKKFPKYVPAEFAHGWYFGITGERLEFSEDTLQSCLERSDDLTNALNDAHDSYGGLNDWKTGAMKMKEFKTLFVSAMANCG
jgi:hypothetical protein